MAEQQAVDAGAGGLDASDRADAGNVPVEARDADMVPLDAAGPDVDAAVDAMQDGAGTLPDSAPPGGDAAGSDAATVSDASGAAQDAAPDASAPDASLPDTSVPDTSVPDASLPDTSVPDTSVPDAAPAADCELVVDGATVRYATGQVGALDGTHILTLAQTAQCAIPTACGVDAGEDVVQGSCSTTPCRMWESIDAGGGWFRLRNASNGLCLYMADASVGTTASDYECFTSDQMHWQVTCAGDNRWYLRNAFSGLALGAGSSGAIVQAAQAGSQQRWTIATNAAAYSVVMTSADNDTNPTWRYTTSAPASTWMQPTFNDSRWSSGPGAFADIRRGAAQLGTSWTSQDIWLRRTFSLSSIPSNLTVRVFHDEGAEIYINGASVATLTHWSNGYIAIDVPASVLRSLVVGTNTIAAHCTSTTTPQIIDLGLVTFTWR